MNFLETIVNLLFDILIVLLFVRYFVDSGSAFQFGPILSMLRQVTDPVVRPVRQFLEQAAPRRAVWAPIVALPGVVLIRGLLFFGADAMRTDAVGANLNGFDPRVYGNGFMRSFEQAADSLFTVTAALLLASTLFTRGGFAMPASLGWQIFQDGTGNLFRFARAIWKVDRLWPLFGGAVGLLAIAHFLFVAIVTLRFLQSARLLLVSECYFLLSAVGRLLGVYWFILVIAIIASWLAFGGAGGDQPVVRGVRALAEPTFRFFRQFRWARWGIIDFSPIFAFLALSFIRFYVLFPLMSDMAARRYMLSLEALVIPGA